MKGRSPKDKTARYARRRVSAIEDMKALSDELRRRDPSTEQALSRMAEAIIILLEDR